MSEIDDLFGFLGKKSWQEKERRRKAILEEGRMYAVQHWKWLEPQLRNMFVEGFTHGYKHGYSDGASFKKAELKAEKN